MIISCVNCNKKYNIDENLIPVNGRLLQCSKCNHKWNYIIPPKKNEIEKINILTKDYKKKQIKINKEISLKKKSSEKIDNKIKINNNRYEKIKNINNKYSIGYLLNNLLIIIITFSALILILDTFKNNISIYLPILIPLLDNLYQSFFDLSSFIRDLLN